MKLSAAYLLFCMLIASITVHAQNTKIYFPYFEVINIDSEIQYSTSKLLKTYIEENHKYEIILPPKPEGIYPKEDFLVSINNAKQVGASYVLIAEINNLGKVAVISLTLYDVSSGNKIWSDLIKGIPTDDFDPVLSRIGRNFATATKAGDDANIYEVTSYEENREAKLLNVQSNNFTGILLGGNYLIDKAFDTRLGLSYYYDISAVVLFMYFEYSTNTLFNFLDLDRDDKDVLKVRGGNFGMGTTIPFTKKKNTLYGTASLEIGLISLYRELPKLDKMKGGLSIYLGTGYLIGRTSSTNIRFDIGMSFPTYTVNNEYLPQLKFGIITSFLTIKKKK